VKTLFLGSYGFGNLGDELCLIEAMQAFPSSESWVWSHDPGHTARLVPGITGFIRMRADIEALKPERIVLGGGGVGFMPSIRDMLHWMSEGLAIESALYVHNIGMALLEDVEWTKAPEVQRVFAALRGCSVRDHMSYHCFRLLPGAPVPAVTLYPEKLIPPDPALAAELPREQPILGVSITNHELMHERLEAGAERVAQALLPFRGWPVLPIISSFHPDAAHENDAAAFASFVARFLPDAQVLLPETLGYAWWHEHMTPRRVKGLIAACTHLVTQRKHNLIHAINVGTPVLALSPQIDDSLARIFFTLRGELPIGCSPVSI
jgi:hypothetical protein